MKKFPDDQTPAMRGFIECSDCSFPHVLTSWQYSFIEEGWGAVSLTHCPKCGCLNGDSDGQNDFCRILSIFVLKDCIAEYRTYS